MYISVAGNVVLAWRKIVRQWEIEVGDRNVSCKVVGDLWGVSHGRSPHPIGFFADYDDDVFLILEKLPADKVAEWTAAAVNYMLRKQGPHA